MTLDELLELSAEAGNGDAYVLLAAIAAQGLAGAADPAAALAYASRGAERGWANAKSQLAGMLVDGAGTAVDLPRPRAGLQGRRVGRGAAAQAHGLTSPRSSVIWSWRPAPRLP